MWPGALGFLIGDGDDESGQDWPDKVRFRLLSNEAPTAVLVTGGHYLSSNGPPSTSAYPRRAVPSPK